MSFGRVSIKGYFRVMVNIIMFYKNIYWVNGSW